MVRMREVAGVFDFPVGESAGLRWGGGEIPGILPGVPMLGGVGFDFPMNGDFVAAVVPSPVAVVPVLRPFHSTSRAGVEGQDAILELVPGTVHKPTGVGMRNLLLALAEVGVRIKPKSFDLLDLRAGAVPDFRNLDSVRLCLPWIRFVEVKTANQRDCKPLFVGMCLAVTKSEITAARRLGARHWVALYNKRTGELQVTTMRRVLARRRSTARAITITLGPEADGASGRGVRLGLAT